MSTQSNSSTRCCLFYLVILFAVDGLSFLSNTFTVVLGHDLSVEWFLKLGSNSTAVMEWGDNSSNETVANNIVANATTPFNLTKKHKYSSEGDYEVKLHVFNFFSNRTISKMAYVQVKLLRLKFTAPTILETNTSFYFNVSLAVVSLSANVTFRFGDGLVFSSTRFDALHYYSRAGVFAADVIVANRASILMSSSRWVTVQDAVGEFTVDSNLYNVALGAGNECDSERLI